MEKVKLACLIFILFFLIFLLGNGIGLTHDLWTGKIKIVQTNYEPKIEKIIFKEILVKQYVLADCVDVKNVETGEVITKCDNPESTWGVPK